MYVKAIISKQNLITKGNVYRVLKENGSYYVVKNNHGDIGCYPKGLFKIVEH